MTVEDPDTVVAGAQPAAEPPEPQAAEPPEPQAAEPSELQAAEPEPQAADSGAAAAPEGYVPRAVVEDLLQRQNAASAVAEEPQAAGPDPVAEVEAKLQEAEKEFSEAVAEGEPDQIAAAQAKLRAAERELARIEAQRAAKAELDRQRVVEAATRFEKQFPQLDDTSPHFDPTAVQEVTTLYKSLVASGASRDPVRAMERAVQYVMAARGIAVPAARQTAAPAKQPVPKTVADVMQNQPPTPQTVGVGRTAGGADPQHVPTVDELAKMSPEELAALRGDVL